LFLLLAALGMFLVYGGQRAVPATTMDGNRSVIAAQQDTRDPGEMQPKFDALSKRIVALADEIARLRQP
jgi:hypothetical protein